MSNAAENSHAGGSERLPTLNDGRIFANYGSFLYTLTTLAAAIWIVLVGGAIPMVGDTRLGIIGYSCGTIVGVVLVVASIGLPSFRYGVDSIDISKASFGIRGSALVMLGLVISALGWAGVALAMVSRGVASMVARVTQPDGVVNEQLVVIVAFGLIALLVLLVRHGLNAIRRLNDFAGPGFLILAVISLSLLLHRYGVRHLWTANVPAEQALTHDRLKSFAYALDFGVTTALSWWPFMGALYRYVKFRRHTVGPILVGGSLVGNVFSASVAALAAVHLGSPDPAVWLTELAGPVAGTAMVCVVLLFSVPAVCMQVFFVAGAIQQLRPLARTPWSWLVALSVAPLSLVAINTAWTLSHIVTVATMGSLVFFAACGIVMADYWVLRRGNIDPPQLFVAGPEGDYWYWGGVNWVAIAVIAASVVGYLGLYNPITLETRSAFRFLGAALPATALSSMAYYALMRSIVIPMKLGGFGGRAMASAGSKPVEVGL